MALHLRSFFSLLTTFYRLLEKSYLVLLLVFSFLDLALASLLFDLDLADLAFSLAVFDFDLAFDFVFDLAPVNVDDALSLLDLALDFADLLKDLAFVRQCPPTFAPSLRL